LNESRKQEDTTRVIVTGIELKCGERVFPRRASFLGFQSIAYGPSDILSSIVINATVFPSALFKSVHFDENLVYGGEELDMACMAVHAGFSIHLLESAINYHYPSPLNREFYKSYTDASRIFVTFKRYRMLQRNRAKASFFLIAAYSHNLLFNLKQRGVLGLRAFFTTLSLSRAYMEALLSNPAADEKKA
jgi:GT2 family glycosyltransferase